MSLAGDTTAESQRQARNTIGYYNLLLGPVAWRFSAGMGMDYDDNVHQSQNPDGDFIFRPNLNTQMHWPVTQKNSLDASLGVGYSVYATHSELNQLYVNPGSGLFFDIYIGDCVINLHDRVSVTENTYQNPTVSGNRSFAQLENAAGLAATWDLNKLVAQFGYDHVDDISFGANSQQAPDATSDTWFADAGVRPLPQIVMGLESGIGLVAYDQEPSAPTQPDALQWNAGAFCKAQISQYLNGRLDAGYTVYTPANTSAFTNLTSAASLYFQLSLTHQVNRFLNYSLSAGRSTDSSLYGQPYDYYYVQLNSNWNVFKKCQLGTPFWWQKGHQLSDQLYGQGGSTDYDQYGAGVTISRTITRKLAGTLAYQFIMENSSQSSLNYTVNIVSLNFSYQF